MGDNKKIAKKATIGSPLIILSVVYIIMCICGIIETKEFSELSNENVSLHVVFFVLPMVFSILSVGLGFLEIFKTKWSTILMIILSIIFMSIFLVLMILTSYGITHWLSSEWTDEIVEKRINLEIEVCFLSFLNL